LAIADVLRLFRDLKKEGTVKDYIVYGSIAAMVHTRPFYTKDVDIGVLVASDMEYIKIFRRLAEFGTVEGNHVVVNGTSADVFPTDVSPIINDAITGARRKKVENVYAKVASPEHLVLEALRAGRREDRARVIMLEEAVDRDKLRDLFERLDHDGELKARYQRLTGQAP
jgi:hypothetical protein